MLHLEKNPKNKTKEIKKNVNLKSKMQKISMHCKIKKPFFGELNRSKLKKNSKSKNGCDG
jgi:hypothetical protein